MIKEELKAAVGNDENILWSGTPDKLCFILEGIFNPLLPFALIWAIFDLGFLSAMLFNEPINEATPVLLFIIPFFLLHLMPVWIYIGGCFLVFRKYQNTAYIVTDKAIYTSGGFISYTIESKPFAELSHINFHRGIFDQMLGVGDVIATSEHDGYNTRQNLFRGITIADIKEYKQVYQLIKQLQTDIYADTMYPNDLRPAENHGYKTKYIRPE